MQSKLAQGDLVIPPSSSFAMRKAGFNFQYAGAGVSRQRDFRTGYSSRTEAEMLPYYDRLRIITRLRQLVRDDPYAAALLSAYPTQLGTSTMSSLENSGSGEEPLAVGQADAGDAGDASQASDQAETDAACATFNDFHERAWLAFVSSVEYCGLSLPEIEAILWREDLIAGELFFLKLKTGKLQLIPSEYCFSEYGKTSLDEVDGLQIKNGIVTGYRFGYRDESSQLQAGKSITPAQDVIHFFFQDRPEQRRGVPRLAPVINTLQDVFEICGAKVNQVKTQSFISGVVTKNYPNDAADLMRGQNSDGTRSDYQELRGGALYYMEPGEDMRPFQSSINANDFDDFLKSRLEAIGGAVGMPPECWIEGFRNSNYSSARATVATWIRTVQARRAHLIRRFLEPVHAFWVEKSPALFRPFAAFDPYEIVFAFPGVPAIDEAKQNEGDAKALAACLTTYAEVYGARGQFWDTQFKQIQRENQRMKALGIVPNFAPNSTPQVNAQNPQANDGNPANDGSQPQDNGAQMAIVAIGDETRQQFAALAAQINEIKARPTVVQVEQPDAGNVIQLSTYKPLPSEHYVELDAAFNSMREQQEISL